jgi:aminomethyltransferase
MAALQKTSLNEQHIKLKAKMVPFAGFSMPIQYESVKKEAMAVRENVGMFDVSHMGEFLVTGPEASKFVNYCITNDLESIENNKAIYSPLCREDGTIIDDLICYKFSNEKVFLCVNASNIRKDFDFFKKQSKLFNCQLEDLSDDYSLIAVQGPKAYEVLNKVCSLQDVEKFSFIADTENQLMFARTGYTGEDGFEIFGSGKNINELWEKLLAEGVVPCGLAARDTLRIEAGYPLYGHELNDEVTPLDSALKWTVKQNKESFVSKESLNNQKPKYQLIKLTLDKGIPREKYQVSQAQQVIGEVTSGTLSVKLGKGIAICRVEREKLSTTDDFYITIRNKQYLATKVKSFL